MMFLIVNTVKKLIQIFSQCKGQPKTVGLLVKYNRTEVDFIGYPTYVEFFRKVTP